MVCSGFEVALLRDTYGVAPSKLVEAGLFVDVPAQVSRIIPNDLCNAILITGSLPM